MKLYLPCWEEDGNNTSPLESSFAEAAWSTASEEGCKGHLTWLGLRKSVAAATKKVLPPLVPPLTAARASLLLHSARQALFCVYYLFRAVFGQLAQQGIRRPPQMVPQG